MRRLVLAALAATALSSPAWATDPATIIVVPQPSAATPVIGYGTFFFGVGRGDTTVDDSDFADLRPRAFGGEAAFGVPAESFHLQFDLRGQSAIGYESSVQFGLTEAAVGGHLTFGGDTFAAGPFAMVSGNFIIDNFDEMMWNGFVGVDVAMQGDRTMLHLQGGYALALNSEDDNFAFWNGFFGRAVGNYYVTPDLRLQAEAGYLHGRTDEGSSPLRGILWGLEAQMKLTGPVALMAGYRGTHTSAAYCFDECPNAAYVEHQLRVGMTILVGAATLRDIDRAAGLTLPDFATAIGLAEDLPYFPP